MKTYIQPETKVVTVRAIQVMATSTGIGEGKALGKGYTSTDVTYSRQDNSWDIWGTDDYDEE